MRVMKWSAIALAVTAASTQLASAAAFVSDQSEATGFVEGSKLDVKTRNYYYNRNNKNGGVDDKDWTQGFFGNFSSGYTQGLIGVGIDAFGYAGFKLDGSDKYSGSGNLVTDSEGKNEDSFGKAGAAVKFRISKTELKIGDIRWRDIQIRYFRWRQILHHRQPWRWFLLLETGRRLEPVLR